MVVRGCVQQCAQIVQIVLPLSCEIPSFSSVADFDKNNCQLLHGMTNDIRAFSPFRFVTCFAIAKRKTLRFSQFFSSLCRI